MVAAGVAVAVAAVTKDTGSYRAVQMVELVAEVAETAVVVD